MGKTLCYCAYSITLYYYLSEVDVQVKIVNINVIRLVQVYNHGFHAGSILQRLSGFIAADIKVPTLDSAFSNCARSTGKQEKGKIAQFSSTLMDSGA